ncbi:MAG: carbonic anhydrase [Gracilimonas sp.]|uniref:carbonic anhydrase family protein n=1 Tax=Gracilimonas TaxID=649462 RepID=UPI001B05132F|nr:carbonic anhydrase family protein [Gracilimonas sp.]MBO6584476.1 carbonic anhydrase [Gracilimonas sp.]MBO6616253.1 carbonic anhydrase [Gracilimonas sp.]
MRKLFLTNILPVLVVTLLFSTACVSQNAEQSSNNELKSEVLTSEAQSELTPQQILNGLKAGNESFVNNNLTPTDYQKQVKATAVGQYPEAIILSCVDSRVPVEQVFDKGVGDVFVARVAGNFVNEDILGSAEFATAVAGSKVVVVMGHKSCGAVKAAIDGVEMGNITAMLDKIEPAVEMTANYSGERSTSNDDYVTEVVNNNVVNTIAEMRENSPIIAELERNGDVVIAGAFYDLETGKVTFLE